MSDSHKLFPCKHSNPRQVKEFVIRFVEEDLVIKVEIQMLAVWVFLQKLRQEVLVEQERNLLIRQVIIQTGHMVRQLLFHLFFLEVGDTNLVLLIDLGDLRELKDLISNPFENLL